MCHNFVSKEYNQNNNNNNKDNINKGYYRITGGCYGHSWTPTNNCILQIKEGKTVQIDIKRIKNKNMQI